MKKEKKADVVSAPFESKDRVYILKKEATPISFQLRSRHTRFNPLLWFDEEAGVQRALRYCTNQRSCFEDEQDKNAILGAIVFEDGTLRVPKSNPTLQKFLSLYHPDRNKVYIEYDKDAVAREKVGGVVNKIKAQQTAVEMDIADLEAIARVVFRGAITGMKSSEIRYDMIQWAGDNPETFMEYANDSDIKLRNLAIRGVDYGLIGVKDDNTTIYWTDNGEVILKLKYGENPYTSLASYFKTDEGLDVMQALMKRLS